MRNTEGLTMSNIGNLPNLKQSSMNRSTAGLNVSDNINSLTLLKRPGRQGTLSNSPNTNIR